MKKINSLKASILILTIAVLGGVVFAADADNSSAQLAVPAAVRDSEYFKPAADTKASMKVSAQELLGVVFNSVPKTGEVTVPMRVTINMDGSWVLESSKLWGSKKPSGKKFRLSRVDEFQVLSFTPDKGGYISKLTPAQQNEIYRLSGRRFEYCLAYVYGSVADGQMSMLFGSRRQ